VAGLVKSLRSVMEHNIVLQVGVKILLENKEGKYLLVHRSSEKYPDVKARWDIVGGRIDPGTELIKNLKREIKEETGLELVGAPKLIAAQDIIPKPDRHVVRLTYVGEAKGKVTLDISENDAYGWYTKEEIENLEGVDTYFKKLLDDVVVWRL
jgi:ADP-ribose pyrophosphatase YjhB (NUDIX family)